MIRRLRVVFVLVTGSVAATLPAAAQDNPPQPSEVLRDVVYPLVAGLGTQVEYDRYGTQISPAETSATLRVSNGPGLDSISISLEGPIRYASIEGRRATLRARMATDQRPTPWGRTAEWLDLGIGGFVTYNSLTRGMTSVTVAAERWELRIISSVPANSPDLADRVRGVAQRDVELARQILPLLPDVGPASGLASGSGSEDGAALAAALTALILTVAGVGLKVATRVADAVEEAVRRAEDDAGPPPPQARRVPPLINPYGFTPLETNDRGQYRHPYEDRWLDPAEARRLIVALDAEVERREQDSAAFDRETRQARAELTARGRARDLAEAEALRREQDSRRRLLAERERIEEIAVRRDDTQVLLRSGDDKVLKDDGTVDGEYLSRLRDTLRSRIVADRTLPGNRLFTGSVFEELQLSREAAREAAEDTIEDASNSLAARVVLGGLTKGASEAFFQSYHARQAMLQAGRDAADRGETLSTGQLSRAFMSDVLWQHLPLGTFEALGRMRTNEAMKRYGKGHDDVGWADVAAAAAGDFLGAMGLLGDLRSTAGALKRAGRTLSQGPEVRGVTRFQQLARDLRYEAPGNPFAAIAKDLSPKHYETLSNWARTATAPARQRLSDLLGDLGAMVKARSADGPGRLSPAEAAMHLKDSRVSAKTTKLVDEVKRASGSGQAATPAGLQTTLRDLDEARLDLDRARQRARETGASVDPRAAQRVKQLELTAQRQAFVTGRSLGQAKVDALERAFKAVDDARGRGADADTLRKLELDARHQVVRVQADKHAMNQMNRLPRDAGGNNATIRRFNEVMETAYAQADQRARESLAKELGVRPDDIQVVKITNQKGAPGGTVDPRAPTRETVGLSHRKKVVEGRSIERTNTGRGHGRVIDAGDAAGQWRGEPELNIGQAKGDKVSFDRDLTMRLRVIDRQGNVVWRDIPSNTMGRHYNEAIFEQLTGRPSKPSSGTGFEQVHLSLDDHLADPLDLTDPDKFAKAMDQATTDRLHAEAYGTGQADLDAATKDVFRGRDFTDPSAVAKTVEFKVHHWMKEADELRSAAFAPGRSPAERAALLAKAASLQEEGMRQLTKQYNNMVVTRTANMIELKNAPGATIPRDLAEKIHVLKGVELGRYTAPEAEEILRRMGSSTEQVAGQMSAYVEGLEKLRAAPPPSRPMPWWSARPPRPGQDDHRDGP